VVFPLPKKPVIIVTGIPDLGKQGRESERGIIKELMAANPLVS
jgi:hypothetical protein